MGLLDGQYTAMTSGRSLDFDDLRSYVRGDDVKDIGVSPDFEDSIGKLENLNDVGDKTPIQNGFAIPQLVDKKEPRDADFEEVKSQIVEVVKLDRANAEIENIANQIASGSANATGLAAAAQAKGLKAEDQKSFVLGSPLGQGPSASTSRGAGPFHDRAATGRKGVLGRRVVPPARRERQRLRDLSAGIASPVVSIILSGRARSGACPLDAEGHMLRPARVRRTTFRRRESSPRRSVRRP